MTRNIRQGTAKPTFFSPARLALTGLFLAGAFAAASLLGFGTPRAQASHNNVACDDDVPAGWSCVPFVNKPQSGPGVTSPAFGELLYKFVDADTMWLAVRTTPAGGHDREQRAVLPRRRQRTVRRAGKRWRQQAS